MKPNVLIEKYRSLPQAARSTVWFTVCNFIVAGVSFLSAPIFTRFISPQQYGLLTLFITFEQLMLILATWELTSSAYQRGLFKFQGQWHHFTLSTILLSNGITLAFFALLFFFFEPVSSFTGMSSTTLLVVMTMMLVQPAYQAWVVRQRTNYNYRAVVPLSIAICVLNVVLPLLAVVYIDATAAVKFNTSMLVTAGVSLAFYVASILKGIPSYGQTTLKTHWRFLITYQAPLILHSLSYIVLGQSDRVMIGKMVGETQAAFYGVAYTMGMAAYILQNSLQIALTPWRYQKLQDGNYPIIRSSTNALLLLLGGGILLFIAVAPELMQLLFTPDYQEALWCIPPVAASFFFMFLFSIFVNVETYFEKTIYIMYASVGVALLNIVLNLLLIPIWGYIVCAYTTLLSYILFAVVHYHFMRRICRSNLPGVSLFSMSAIVSISLLVLLLTVLLTLAYPYWYLRYALILLMCLVAWAYRRHIAQIVAIVRHK